MKHAYREQNAKTVEKRTLPPTQQSQSIVDNRPTTIAQRKLIAGMHNVVQFVHPRLIEINQEVKSLEADLRYTFIAIRNNIDSFQDYSVLFRHYLQEINNVPEESPYKNNIKAHIENILRRLTRRINRLIIKRINQDVESLEVDLRSTFIATRHNINSFQEYFVLFRQHLQEINNVPEESPYKNNIKARIEKILRRLARRINRLIITKINQDVESLEADLISTFIAIRHNINSIQKYSVLFRHYQQEINNVPEESPYKNNIKAHIGAILRLLERRLGQLSIKAYRKTYQEDKTFKCWFLSVFEGLRRSGLLLQTLQCGNWEGWQKILENQFMHENNIDDKTMRPKTETDLKSSFNKFFEPSLPAYEHSLQVKNFCGLLQDKMRMLPQDAELESGIHINEDASEIYFYTIDKPGHAMFYIKRVGTNGVLVYNQAGQKEEIYYLNDKDEKKLPNMIQKHTFRRIS